MKRIAVFMGTRPEAIKLAPVIASLRGRTDVAVQVVSTGQHREMRAQPLAVYHLTPAEVVLLLDDHEFAHRAQITSPYRDGRAAQKIAGVLCH